MTRGTQRTFVILVILGGGLAGWWLTRNSWESRTEPLASKPKAPKYLPPQGSGLKDSKLTERKAGLVKDSEAEAAGAFQNQRSLMFSDRAALEAFLERAKGKGIAVLGQIDRLNALHVGFLSADELASLLDGTEETGFIYPVTLPTPKTDGIQDGAVGFGTSLLGWLGITGDNSTYGSGVKVAVLDTGSTLAGVQGFNLVDLPSDPSAQNGHGTAVTDLIRQIAPGTDLFSFRIANDEGQSNSFLLAQGVDAATAAGVDIINISMASYGNSTLLRMAVEQAQAAGIKIFASTGNEGYEQVAYPAGYQGVVAVGAVDANGTHLDFSNSGNVTLVAPGLDLVTAWVGGKSVYFTGTSASSPIGAGVLAAAMSSGGQKITAAKAYDNVANNLNEAGAPGVDSFYGGGSVDFGRVLRAGSSGVGDVALASNYVSTNGNGQNQLQVTVQNRGTDVIYNAPLEVTTSSGGTRTMTITSLKPGDIATFTLPFNIPSNGATVQSQVTLPSASDIKPSNNRRSDAYAAPASN
ncbi:S8 family peptidase [Luteolibacter luteus]|uniref:S8 family serine peptidase n=1 Tax=Luteolibacter luteus TaxID=2728835 RepID=A0A858RPX0_9BACT|nr:S8 family serine peptidase [Luteolibacter luteus]QJE97973.1 S8 family serine peptidase [Luteolibacter luteus]